MVTGKAQVRRQKMEFEDRLEKAIERGHRAGDARARAEAERALTEKELQRLHSQYRLELSEHIERCLTRLADRFPGFRFETIVGPRGWGAAISRDDLRLKPPRDRRTRFSRLEMVITPVSPSLVLELVAKATVGNREIFSRTHFQRLTELDTTSFAEMIDLWVLEYAERYAAA
jgi:hypothetical protein